MMGVAVTVGVLALLASLAATLTNMVIKRASGRNTLTIELDDYPAHEAFRLAGLTRAATLFYRQALLLWSALGVILSLRFLGDLGIFTP